MDEKTFGEIYEKCVVPTVKAAMEDYQNKKLTTLNDLKVCLNNNIKKAISKEINIDNANCYAEIITDILIKTIVSRLLRTIFSVGPLGFAFIAGLLGVNAMAFHKANKWEELMKLFSEKVMDYNCPEAIRKLIDKQVESILSDTKNQCMEKLIVK